MYLARYLGLLCGTEEALARAFMMVSERHNQDAEVRYTAAKLASWSSLHLAGLAPFVARYGTRGADEPSRLRDALFSGLRAGGLGLVRDLSDLVLLATEVELARTAVAQAARALRDVELEDACRRQ